MPLIFVWVGYYLESVFLDTSAVIKETEKINGRFLYTQTLVVGIGRLGITLCIMVDSRGSAYSKIVAVFDNT